MVSSLRGERGWGRRIKGQGQEGMNLYPLLAGAAGEESSIMVGPFFFFFGGVLRSWQTYAFV